MARARTKSGRFAKKGEVERRQKVAEHAKKLNAEVKQKKKLRQDADNREPLHSVGSRVVDLAILANNLWCNTCKAPLSLKTMEKEVHKGLASIVHVRCVTCLDLIEVPTSKPVRVEGSSYPLWSVNMKAAAGCLDSGVGHEQFNNLISCLNIPTVNHHTMKRAEAKVGASFEKEAKESMKRAILEEKRLTEEAHRSECLTPPLSPEGLEEESVDDPGQMDYINNPLANPSTGLTSEYDWGWDKRGSGHDYNSKSGRGAAIGFRSKKVLGVKVAASDCSKCRRGHQPEDHDCRKNHVGSAKSMEPQGAVDLMVNNKDWEEAGVHLDTLIGDEDASTFARVQQQTRHNVKKWVDLNHCRGSFSKRLYKLRSKFSFLDSKCIKYLKKCFSYAIQQHKGEAVGLAEALRNVVSHVHGEHDNCGEWCNARGKPTYFFKSLPRGQCWKGGPEDPWRKALTSLMDDYARKADRIAPCASSQGCESFNSQCVIKAPKNRYYGSTPALSFRVCAAVLQKNEGANHMTSVNTTCGLSPGGITAKYRARMQKLRQKKGERQKTVQFKRRRLQLQLLRSGEGEDCVEYVSGMASTMERAVAAATDLNAWIPEELPRSEDCAIVIIDTETTGLGGDAEIVQLAARCGDRSFDAYMLPTKKISPMAEEKTGLRVQAGDLYYHSQKVSTKPPVDVANEFVEFLSSLGSQVVLVGHNVIRFDIPHVLKFMSRHGLARVLCSMTYGITDTLQLLKQGKGQSSKQDVLAAKYLTGPEWAGVHQGAHNAATDCHLLSGLLHYFEVDEEKLVSSSISMKAYLEKQALNKKQKNNLPELAPLKDAVSKATLGKMAKHGISMEELKSEWTKHGREGIKVCLGVRVNGKPRVTDMKRIVDSVCECVEKLCDAQ